MVSDLPVLRDFRCLMALLTKIAAVLLAAGVTMPVLAFLSRVRGQFLETYVPTVRQAQY